MTRRTHAAPDGAPHSPSAAEHAHTHQAVHEVEDEREPLPTSSPVSPRGSQHVVLDLLTVRGLTDDDARERLRTHGPNALPTAEPRSIAIIALDVVREPMFLMLVSAGALYFAMGEVADALMLLGFVLVVMGITIGQTRRTERALDALRDLSSPRALVIRGGARHRVPGREVVPGDMLILSEGDRVPADGIVRQHLGLQVDESLLTGESVPVRKSSSQDADTRMAPGGDDLPSVFSGTLVTAGQALVEVSRTGANSELGRIGKTLKELKPEPTTLQRETNRMVQLLAKVGLSACLVVVVAYALTRGSSVATWRDGLLAGIAMAMATLPEELPVVLTVFLALGAWRIAKNRVLTRRMPAIEMLGSATVLCVDKTGTLTQNQMTLRALWPCDEPMRAHASASVAPSDPPGTGIDLAAHDAPRPLPPSCAELLELAVLASKRDPFDPMERAIHAAGADHLHESSAQRTSWSLVREYPLTADVLAVSHVWTPSDAHDPTSARIATKGAPEAVASLCDLSNEERAHLMERVALLAQQGLRVLAVARGRVDVRTLPEHHGELRLELIGLLGLEDPLRPAVPAAVAECHRAGIRVVMITGDYPMTARAMAHAAGLEDGKGMMTGPELATLSDEAFAERVDGIRVFARVVPEQKLRIVQALKARGEIVAMTGDGVNDAPALKAAHIGIAMGGRGTDVAREAASLVLLDDDFTSIVAAIRLGRRIFDNIKKAIAFTLAVHIPIAGLSMVPVFLRDWPLLLLPVHIVFLELIIDPSCSLIFEAEAADPGIMLRPPRRPNETLFGRSTVALAVLQGLSVFVACLSVFIVSHGSHSADASRALTFTTLVVGALVIILVNRSWSRSSFDVLKAPNAAFRWVVGGTIAVLAVVLVAPGAHALFHFAPVHLDDVAMSLVAGGACTLWFEVWKRRHRTEPHGS